jgi:hypothetical protein
LRLVTLLLAARCCQTGERWGADTGGAALVRRGAQHGGLGVDFMTCLSVVLRRLGVVLRYTKGTSDDRYYRNHRYPLLLPQLQV